MARIAVDIDSTLYDFEQPSRDACFKLWKETGDEKYKQAAYHPWTEWRSPADVLGVERWLKAIAVVHDDDAILGMEPFTGAVETCQALIDAGHELIYISNRATETEYATERWLDEWGFSDLVIDGRTSLVVTQGDKAPFIKDCQYLIDDRLKTAVTFTYDFEWDRVVRQRAGWMRKNATSDPALDEELNRLLEHYYESGCLLPKSQFDRLHEIENRIEADYMAANQRRAFVKAYPYNQGATDIPRLSLAPTWHGLSHYLHEKGVLPQVVAA
jgi:hypothetical protein